MAITKVGSNTAYLQGSTGTVSSLALAFPADVKNGSLLLASCSLDSAFADGATYTTTKSDVFSQSVTGGAAPNDYVSIGRCEDAVGGATTVTVTPDGTTWVNLAIGEFQGQHQSPADGTSGTTGSGTAPLPGNITTTAAGLLWTQIGIRESVTYYMPDPGSWFLVGSDETWNGAGGWCAYELQSAGTHNCEPTLSSSQSWEAAMAAFKEGDVRPRILAKSNASIVSGSDPTATLTVPSGASDGYFFASVKWVSSASMTVNGVSTSVSNGINGSGTAFTAVGSSLSQFQESGGDNVYIGVQWWYGKNPSVGAHTITADFAAAPNESVVEVFFVENVDGTTPFSDVQTMTDGTTATTKSFTFTTGNYTRAIASGIEYVGAATQTVTVSVGQSQFAKNASNWWGIAAAVGTRFRQGATTGVTFTKSNGKYASFSGFVIEPPSAGGSTTIDLTSVTLSSWSAQSSQSTLAASVTSPAWASWVGQAVDAVTGRSLSSATWASWAGQTTQNSLTGDLGVGSVPSWTGQSTQNTTTSGLNAGSVPAWTGQDTQNATATTLSAGSMGFTSQVITVLTAGAINLLAATMQFTGYAITLSGTVVASVKKAMGMIGIGRMGKK